MSDIDLVDVTVHIDEELDAAGLANLEQALRDESGVVSVHFQPGKPHLAVVEYNPEATNSASILSRVTSQNLHAELIGL